MLRKRGILCLVGLFVYIYTTLHMNPEAMNKIFNLSILSMRLGAYEK